MLKALELVGFKSFADKTRFEFPRGISAIVGPNGSGKSNVVDAIKWVLGEQSVKSLRGKEMADCIFNGSASRPPLNMAETTLVFDNSERRFAVDAPEVAITRRVYRSGESEYLVNHQASRLRDFRDLFAGTGVATEAYSIIEQGKVDVMLQSSPRDRRAIFEEAAGISRFKAKKLESLRRLDRVEQNLLRLSDIVSEVENRLRSVRQQASKARRYQEHADRLQALRTQVGLADWRRLSKQLESLERELIELADRRDLRLAEAEALDAEALSIETSLIEIENQLRRCEAQSAEQREQIASLEASIGHERSRSNESADEVSRLRKQLASLGVRAGDVRQQLHETFAATSSAETLHRQALEDVAVRERQVTNIAAELSKLHAEDERLRLLHVEQLRQSASIESGITAGESHIAKAKAALELNAKQRAEFSESRAALDVELAALATRQEALARTIKERQAEFSQATARIVAFRQMLSSHVADLNQLQQRHTGASERAALLEELENRFEGLETGVSDILMVARQATDGPFRSIRGLVADLLRVNVDTAALIDIALGEHAQHVVVEDDGELLTFLERDTYRFKGRVTFIPNNSSLDDDTNDVELTGPGVVGRADRMVETEADMLPLCRRLLGRTWIVEKLADARRLAGNHRGQTFVTQAGETLGPDGAVSTGPRQAMGGLISRRSELRALRESLVELGKKIAITSEECTLVEQKIAAEDVSLEKLAELRAEATAAASDLRIELNAAESRSTQLNEQIAAIEGERLRLERELAASETSVAELHRRRVQLAAAMEEQEGAASSVAERLANLTEERLECERQATAAKVELAKSEERLGNLRARQGQFERDQQERQRTLDESRAQLAGAEQREVQSSRKILQAESQLAWLYLAKEQLHAESWRQADERSALRQQRAERVSQAGQTRSQARKTEESHHARELEANQVRLERQNIAQRLREDYQIELAEHEASPSDEELHEREAVEQEIADLRRKLNQLGNVNLDSLGELQELETRFATLREQHDDLDKAKRLLVEVIERINADSRRLFSETLEQVRTNFQTLFRKLFGGGQADIVLDSDVDILDCGIEIVARPPGKEPRNISLLSGGEKTLTCVALLLAIFQYRPSPFCVLDEVDAALDEANIERFVGVLEEFLEWTQFIVVTHSKKTMTCASTLYGVTMQESGVSKRVAVRFDDVSDDGQIRATAPDGDETQAA